MFVHLRTWRVARSRGEIVETTSSDITIRTLDEADFVTLQRRTNDQAGVGDDLAAVIGAALLVGHDYAGARRVSPSGRSYVFERDPGPTGASVGIEAALAEARL